MANPLPLEDYALIGDCETAALVGRNGSIDWLCWPRFDSDACFAALLGTPDHGRWLLAPSEPASRVTRRYRGDTMILETTFETATGVATVIDFMPPRSREADLVRIVRGVEGRVAMRSELVLRFDYGHTVPWVSRLDERTLRAIAGPSMVIFRTAVRTRGENRRTIAEFEVAAGESVDFVLAFGYSHEPPPRPVDAEPALQSTEAFWTEWAGRGLSANEWTPAVTRSLLTLKALTYAPTGGIVAAPTTSLPEKLGGSRNWDYRYCWLRDATLVLLALLNSGHYEEARDWRAWLVRAAAGAPEQLQIMYGVAGERRLTEQEIDWLPGYADSRPVRVGNAAHRQLQLDVFGEVEDTLHQALKSGLEPQDTTWTMQRSMLHHLERIWMEPDEGIWEVRGPRQHFTFSKVMCWVAFDRAVKSVEEFGRDGPVERWRALREQIHAEVCERAWDPGLGSFVQAYGSQQLDASLLMLPTLGFLPASDPRIVGTIAAIERRL
ncbi:MAG TPA: glycoside hydrolase family 15 protein, partial [Gemmatimonadaceae bacterium]